MDPVTLGTLAVKYGPSLMKHSGMLKGGYDWLFGKKAPGRAGSMSPRESNYLNFLQSQAKTGMGQQVINQQLGATSRAAHQGVDVAKANIMGGGIASGIEGSGVMAEQGTVADSAAILAMANSARSIAERNRQVKDQAQVTLGQYGIGQTNQRYQEALANRARRDTQGTDLVNEFAALGKEYSGKVEHQGRLDMYVNEEWFQNLPEKIQMLILSGGGQ